MNRVRNRLAARLAIAGRVLRRWSRSLLLDVAVVALIFAFTPASPTAPDAARFLNHVKFLASTELRGRGTGTPELDKAARYLADRYRSFGLEPAFGKSYLQPFTVTTNARLGKQNRFQDTLYPGKYKVEQDFIPFNFSSSGKLSAEVVFAGYGITAAEYQYDDYAGLDVRGKFVLVLRFEPQEFDENSIFQGKTYTRHAQFDAKAINAKMHGAKGVLLINNPVTHPADSHTLERFGRTAGPSEAGVAFVQIQPQIAERWFAASGRNLREVVEGIDRDLQPRSFPFDPKVQVELEVEVLRDPKTVHNVAAYWPGETEEYVVIGAHYDHLGRGEQASLAPSQIGQVHPGADDNASGVAGVLELAMTLSQERRRRGTLFVNFAGEELGLLGSSYFVNHPPRPLEKCAAMINLDMIGRMRDGAVIIGGVSSGTRLKEVITERAPRFPQLKLEYGDQAGIGASDHTSFTTRQIPVLFFFTGLHGDYHRPTDTWDKINARGAVELLRLVAEVADSLANGERPQFVRLATPAPPASGPSSSSGYGPSFGSVPDMAYPGKGVRFSDVREGSPAAKAGLRGGDVMVEFDGKPIDNLYDFTYALRGKSPGDRVAVRVLRSGQPVMVEVLLEARK